MIRKLPQRELTAHKPLRAVRTGVVEVPYIRAFRRNGLPGPQWMGRLCSLTWLACYLLTIRGRNSLSSLYERKMDIPRIWQELFVLLPAFGFERRRGTRHQPSPTKSSMTSPPPPDRYRHHPTTTTLITVYTECIPSRTACS
jgi:hypothetical protein